MKNTIALILTLCALTTFGQNDDWFENRNIIWGQWHEAKEDKIRIDTIHGLIVNVVPVMGEVYHPELDTSPVFWGGYRTEVIYYTASVSEGIRIDTIESILTEVPCPDNLIGCLVFHWGWTDKRTGFRYESDGYAIETKNVIHFVEK